jgi:hypothetical protein
VLLTVYCVVILEALTLCGPGLQDLRQVGCVDGRKDENSSRSCPLVEFDVTAMNFLFFHHVAAAVTEVWYINEMYVCWGLLFDTIYRKNFRG